MAKRFGSKRGQSTSASEHFWKLRCRNSGRHWGTKHMSKSKRTKHTMFGAVLESQMLKRCSRLWPETHFKVKMLKALSKSNVLKIDSGHFWTLRGRKSARRCGAKHIEKSKCEKTHHVRPLLDVQASFFSWQAQWILHLYKKELNVWVL